MSKVRIIRIDQGHILTAIFLAFIAAEAILLVALMAVGMWRLGWC